MTWRSSLKKSKALFRTCTTSAAKSLTRAHSLRADAALRITMNVVKPRIAIPQPHSQKPEYNQRTLPLYKHAIEPAGGEPVDNPLAACLEEVAKIVTSCRAVVLRGSPAD